MPLLRDEFEHRTISVHTTRVSRAPDYSVLAQGKNALKGMAPSPFLPVKRGSTVSVQEPPRPGWRRQFEGNTAARGIVAHPGISSRASLSDPAVLSSAVKHSILANCNACNGKGSVTVKCSEIVNDRLRPCPARRRR